jgi:hypothetical protein
VKISDVLKQRGISFGKVKRCFPIGVTFAESPGDENPIFALVMPPAALFLPARPFAPPASLEHRPHLVANARCSHTQGVYLNNNVFIKPETSDSNKHSADRMMDEKARNEK